jgi:hypothetical protein
MSATVFGLYADVQKQIKLLDITHRNMYVPWRAYIQAQIGNCSRVTADKPHKIPLSSRRIRAYGVRIPTIASVASTLQPRGTRDDMIGGQALSPIFLTVR